MKFAQARPCLLFDSVRLTVEQQWATLDKKYLNQTINSEK